MNTTPAAVVAGAPDSVIWFVYGVMTVVMLGGLLLASRSLNRDRYWTFGMAISDGDGKASASRLIAFLGFLVIVAVILGLVYSSVWVFLKKGDLPTLSGATTFLMACASLFAPYLANQLGVAVAAPSLAAPVASVVTQTSTTLPLAGPPVAPPVGLPPLAPVAPVP